MKGGERVIASLSLNILKKILDNIYKPTIDIDILNKKGKQKL